MVDVVLLRLRIRPGLPRLFAEAFVRLLLAEQFVMRRGGPFGRALRRWLNAELEPILAEEGMHTESVFLEHDDGELALLWYMESEGMEGVYEGFLESDHAMTDVAGRIGGWLFEEPERILSPDVESDYPLLAHAWNPDRP
jgi:hypothetical protein